jgi:hypothetical protein
VALYAAGHIGFAIAVTLGVVIDAALPGALRLGAGAFVIATLGVLGGLLDGRQWARSAEAARLAGLVSAGLLLSPEMPVGLGIVMLGVLSVFWLSREGRWGMRTGLRRSARA